MSCHLRPMRHTVRQPRWFSRQDLHKRWLSIPTSGRLAVVPSALPRETDSADRCARPTATLLAASPDIVQPETPGCHAHPVAGCRSLEQARRTNPRAGRAIHRHYCLSEK